MNVFRLCQNIVSCLRVSQYIPVCEILILVHLIRETRCTSVSILTRLRAGRKESDSLQDQWDFFSWPPRLEPTQHLKCIPLTRLQLVPRLRMRGAVTPLPHTPSWSGASPKLIGEVGTKWNACSETWDFQGGEVPCRGLRVYDPTQWCGSIPGWRRGHHGPPKCSYLAATPQGVTI
jgi:hypothetical protein